MAGKIKNKFQSAKADSADATKVSSSEWNDSLVVSEGVNDDLMKRDTGATDGWSLVSWLTYIAAKLFLGAAGAVGAPAHSFSGDPDTGMYNSGANTLDFATGGIRALSVNPTQFLDSPTQPRCTAYNNVAQSLNDITETTLNLNSETLDVGAMHDNAVNNSRITIPTGGTGLYLIFGSTSWAGNAAGRRILYIYKNGATYLAADERVPYATGNMHNYAIAIAALNAGDYVELRAYQSSGGALNAGAGTTIGYETKMSAVKLW